MKIPPDSIELHETAKKYGLTWGGLRKAIDRKRLKGFKIGLTWFTTPASVKRYLENRHDEKIPKKYRKKA